MDNSEVVLEKLNRGAILGAYSFLVADETRVIAKCATPVHIYTIEREKFTELVQRDPVLM